MTHSELGSFLNGKVLKRSLTAIQGRPAPGAPRLKRLLLDQGELAHFWDGDTPIHYLAFVELRAGAFRGNHFHRVKRELFYVISGEALLSVEDIATRQRAEVPLRPGDLAEISVEIAHAFTTVAPGHAIEFSEAKFDAADVQPFRVV
jgi:mannose-6-phosphate isomerase-like protein (cupin superfamily)